MEFQKERCFTAVNADELKVGSKVFVADILKDLKNKVESNNFEPVCLVDLNDESCAHRFVTDDRYLLAYLVSEPEEKKLKWTDLKIGDVIRRDNMIRMVTGFDTESDSYHILLSSGWLDDDNLENWEKVEDDN